MENTGHRQGVATTRGKSKECQNEVANNGVLKVSEPVGIANVIVGADRKKNCD